MINRTKIASLAVCAILSAAVLTGCGGSASSSSDSQNSGSDSTASGTAFKIGGTGPLTGANAIYGNACKNGAQIAVDEINAEGGDIQFELNYQDDEGDAEKAQAALKTVTKRLDMAAAKHVIHKNQASNRKSGLAKLVNSINA